MTNEERMTTSRPTGKDEDAFALRLSWDETEDDADASAVATPRHRREEPRNGVDPAATDVPVAPPTSGSDEPIGPAVHDLVNRVELRRIGAAVEDLRRELARLREDVTEQPSAPIGDDPLDELRAEITALRAQLSGRRPEDGSLAAPALQPLVDEIVALRGEVVALKRRIAVRATPSTGDPTGEQADRIAHLVAERLAGWPPPPAT